MTKQSLEEFFAKADDVLSGWHGSLDSMNTGGGTALPGHFREDRDDLLATSATRFDASIWRLSALSTPAASQMRVYTEYYFDEVVHPSTATAVADPSGGGR